MRRSVGWAGAGVLMVLLVLAGLVVALRGTTGGAARPAAAPSPAGSRAGVLAGAPAGSGAGASAASGVRGPGGDDADAVAERQALEVLRAWDARRSAAWALGSEPRLRALYAPHAEAAAADVHLLRAYRARGVRVRGWTTQVLALDVLHRGTRRLQLSVTDRVTGMVAVRGSRRLRLPRDAATMRVLTLVRSPGSTWRVAVVRDR